MAIYLRKINNFSSLLLLLLVIALITLVSSCKKDELSELPPITQTGQNTFGCLVNGKVVILHHGNFWQGDGVSIPHIDKNIFLMAFTSDSGQFFSFSIDSLNVAEGTTYILSKDNTKGFTSAKYNANVNANPPPPDFTTNDTAKGSLTITKYSLYNGTIVIAGIFNYDAVNAKGETVKITNGRFDFRL